MDRRFSEIRSRALYASATFVWTEIVLASNHAAKIKHMGIGVFAALPG
jgi:hypothetical protein